MSTPQDRTLEGVKTIAGYVRSKNGCEGFVVFFINHPYAKRGQDALIEWTKRRQVRLINSCKDIDLFSACIVTPPFPYNPARLIRPFPFDEIQGIKKMKKIIAAALLAFSTFAPANAADQGFYAAVDAGQVSFKGGASSFRAYPVSTQDHYR